MLCEIKLLLYYIIMHLLSAKCYLMDEASFDGTQQWLVKELLMVPTR